MKIQNILIKDFNDFSTLKLIDFGFSTYNNKNLTKQCGTIMYMAPEFIKKKTYGTPVDLWSVGIIMFMLLNEGKHPFFKNRKEKRIFMNNIKYG